MTISKTKNGTYRLKVYIPIEARMPLGTLIITIMIKGLKQERRHDKQR